LEIKSQNKFTKEKIWKWQDEIFLPFLVNQKICGNQQGFVDYIKKSEEHQ